MSPSENTLPTEGYRNSFWQLYTMSCEFIIISKSNMNIIHQKFNGFWKYKRHYVGGTGEGAEFRAGWLCAGTSIHSKVTLDDLGHEVFWEHWESSTSCLLLSLYQPHRWAPPSMCHITEHLLISLKLAINNARAHRLLKTWNVYLETSHRLKQKLSVIGNLIPSSLGKRSQFDCIIL